MDIDRFLPQSVEGVRPTWHYRAGLLGVGLSLLILQAVYLGMVAAAAYATYFYVSRLPAILESIHLNWLTIIVVVTPVIVGIIVTFFLLKPLLARPARQSDAVQLDPASDPIVFAFVHRLCRVLDAPTPTRIDIDLQANASARFRRGWYSLHANDLTLTIGLPLVSGLTMSQFTGVLAHEFGHFSQHAGMRLHFLIASIRHWFARVAYERDKWDEQLDSWRHGAGWRARAILSIAYATVLASRSVLRGLLYVANMVSAWFSRQMEFDADRWEAAVVGAQTFGETLSRLPVLSFSAHRAWQTLETAWSGRRLCDDFAQLVKSHDASLDAEIRKEIVQTAFAVTSDRWATHPSNRDRVSRVNGIRGVLPDSNVVSGGEPPARMLFVDFGAICRKVTLHHYHHSLGDKLNEGAMIPALEFLASTAVETRRAQAIQSLFGPSNRPARWFRLPDEPLEGDITLNVFLEDQTAKYWRRLEESLNRYAALEFVRAGGKVNPSSFGVSNGDLATIQPEAQASRLALEAEIEILRDRYKTTGYLLSQYSSPLHTAYAAMSDEQENLLKLRHQWAALQVIRKNLQLLPAAAAANAIETHSKIVRHSCDAILARLSQVKYPLAEADSAPASLADQLLMGATDLAGPQELPIDERASRVLDRSDSIAEEILGAICEAIVPETPQFAAAD